MEGASTREPSAVSAEPTTSTAARPTSTRPTLNHSVFSAKVDPSFGQLRGFLVHGQCPCAGVAKTPYDQRVRHV